MHMDDIGRDELGHTGSEVHLMRELVRASQVVLAAFGRDVGMAGARLAVLRLLAVSEPGSMGTMELSRRLGVNAAAVTRQLQAMEAEGLVVRVGDGRDARRSAAALTDAGRECFRVLHERAHAFEQRIVAAVGAEEVAMATRVLGRVREAVESEAQGANDGAQGQAGIV